MAVCGMTLHLVVNVSSYMIDTSDVCITLLHVIINSPVGISLLHSSTYNIFTMPNMYRYFLRLLTANSTGALCFCRQCRKYVSYY